ncbi:hypothetical protein [Paludisphaera mucosa]|uniref:Transmembrane protein n=1 Tax=Paludisphaera mucosa TaxID=3030827 RepID=A0ABT6FA00_9BACT|nr:hypothetical protein [Paludisphaera mucosa]MDG3004411.1 hypothetical protein [Paludisphaera mucosa]
MIDPARWLPDLEPGGRPALLIAMLLSAFLLGAVFVAARRPNSRLGPLPLSASPHLRDVVEPIVLVESISIDDGGSRGASFRDARGKDCDFCLVDYGLQDWGKAVRPDAIAFDAWGDGDPVPVRGPDERALLGLLERWAATAPLAIPVKSLSDRHERGEISTQAFRNALTEDQVKYARVMAILRVLRNRN